MKKRFICIFPLFENTHLTKDIGQIGNAFSEIENVKPYIVCYGNDDYPTLKTETKHQTIIRIKNKGQFLFFEKAVLKYLVKESKNIDFLHVQQLNKADVYQVMLYKLLNPKGKVFLKNDMHISDLQKGMVYSKKKFFNSFHRFFEKIALKKISVIAVDSEDLLHVYEEKYPFTRDKLVLFSHNLNDIYLNDNFPSRRRFEEKENIILTTGRIGASDKNYEMLLNTLPLIDLKDWKVIFVGQIYNDFDKKVEKILKDNPNLKGKIELTGRIDDRYKLYEYYDRAKVFCLTSVLESFGVSYIESLYFGNYILGTTGMSSFDYISKGEEFGEKVEVNDTNALAICFNDIINQKKDISTIENKAYDHISANFFLSKNIRVLRKILDE